MLAVLAGCGRIINKSSVDHIANQWVFLQIRNQGATIFQVGQIAARVGQDDLRVILIGLWFAD